jgi:catechol 2,3-dioxygenase-like lactoylglutathione lyase family enzyme
MPTALPMGPVLKSVMLVVKDTEQSRRFYAEVLGFEEKIDAGDFSSVVTPNGVEIELHAPHEGHDHSVASNSTQLSLEVDDVDKWHAVMSARGVPFSQRPKKMPWGTREAYLRDPDGYLIAVVERRPDKR